MEERVDLVDASGRVCRYGVARSEVRQHKKELLEQGLYQPIVIVVVTTEDGRIVAQVRGAGKAGDGDGEVDHVCGVISSGETWSEAARREAREEIGVELASLRLVTQGVNVYDRYRTLATAIAIGTPIAADLREVSSVFCADPGTLQAAAQSGTPFVHGFFDDLRSALAGAVVAVP